MKSGGRRNEIVDRSPHHGCPNHSLCFFRVVFKAEILPNPERSGIEGSLVIANDELLAILFVVFKLSTARVLKRPIQSFLIDLSTAVANLISLMKLSLSVARRDLDSLPGFQLDL